MTDEEIAVTTWIRILGTFLGWPPSRVTRWAIRYAHDMSDPDSWFYHETDVYYIVPLLIPKAIRDVIVGLDLRALEGRIEQAILQEHVQIGEHLLDKYDWVAAKERVERVLAEYGASLEDARRELEQGGAES